jgi:hypothetical protein
VTALPLKPDLEVPVDLASPGAPLPGAGPLGDEQALPLEAGPHRKAEIQAGFHEKELHRVVRQYGNIAHVFSTYETTEGMGANVRRSRGVNSLQLYFDGTRWWVASVTWQSEDAAHPLPPELLP